MSLWMTEEVLRWTVRCWSRSRTSVWQQQQQQQQRSLSLAASITAVPSQQRAQTSSLKPRPTRLVRAVRFYSQERIPRHEQEERDVLPSVPPEVQLDDASDSGPRQKSWPFANQLERCGSPSDVLDLTTQYAPTTRQISNCLTVMWTSTKKMTDDQRRYELQLMFEHPAFEELLRNASRTAAHMRLEDLAYTLLAMVNLGVSQRSRVVQTFLRTCQEKLNDSDERCLSILASSLEHMEDTPNVTALKAGLRLVVEERLCEIKNVMTLQTIMRLLGKDASKELKWKLEKKALSMADHFSLPNAQCMISTMAAMDFYSKPLLDVCSKKISENLHGIPFNKLLKLLLSCRELLYKDVEFLTSVSNFIASTIDVWTNKQSLLLLSAFESVKFCPDAFMEAYAEKVMERADSLTLRDLLCVLKVYSSLNYDLRHQRQQFVDSVSCAVESYLPKVPVFMLLKSVYCLCLLGHFPAAPLELLLQGDAVQQLSAAQFQKSRERMLRTVDLCLRLDRPPLPRPLAVPSDLLGDPAASPSVNPWLSKALRGMLGDQAEATLQEAVLVENFYLIDGVITKPKSEASGCAEEESSPAGSSRRVAVVYAAQSSFCFGTLAPRGVLALKIRHLKLLGYEPVLVSEAELQPLSEEERSLFLRGRIFPEHHR